MRNILFKAKRIDNGEWVEGYYTYYPGGFDRRKDTEHVINETCSEPAKLYYVKECTICQYTGLTDKNGRKIWENDIVFVTDDEGCSGQVDTGVGTIDFLCGAWYVDGNVQNGLYDIAKVMDKLIVVIGNIFDNQDFSTSER